MKKLFLMLFLLPLAAMAQKDYKLHTVGPKESLSSIGRLYNINGRELANYNHIDYDKGLAIGQVLKIPIKNEETPAAAPPQPVVTKPKEEVKPAAATVKTNAPVYHIVEKKQTLYAISKMYGVTVAEIKQWNKLTADGVSEGAKIIVGYSGSNAVEKPSQPVVTVKEQEKPKKDIAVQKKEELPPVQSQATESKPEPPVVKKETPPAVKTAEATGGSGIFKSDFDVQAKTNHIITENGNAGIFKSTSGWQDGKYYCLHNMAAPGTIIKIINNANGKFIYAKVLDIMPDIKQNNGLVVCVSNAAADVLGAANGKLDCTLNYSK